MTVFAVVAMVCATLLAALVLVLRHLAAMRATDGETARLRDEYAKLVARLEDLSSKLTLVSNRTQK